MVDAAELSVLPVSQKCCSAAEQKLQVVAKNEELNKA